MKLYICSLWLMNDLVREGHIHNIALGIHEASAKIKETIIQFINLDFLLPYGLEVSVEFVGQKSVAMKLVVVYFPNSEIAAWLFRIRKEPHYGRASALFTKHHFTHHFASSG